MPQVSPIELTDREVENLLKTFLRGRHEVTEDDCVTLVDWARETRARYLILDMMLDGSIQPIIQDGQVSVQLPPAATGRAESR